MVNAVLIIKPENLFIIKGNDPKSLLGKKLVEQICKQRKVQSNEQVGEKLVSLCFRKLEC